MLISILMPVKNEALHIGEAIESILGQSHKDFELIIVDDHSDDHTRSVVEEFLQDDRIKLFQNEVDPGKNISFNIAFDNCLGEIICLMGGDDTMPLEGLAHRVDAHTQNSMIVMARLKTFSTYRKYDNLIYPRKLNVANYSGGAISMSRDLAEKMFPLPESLPNEDIWLKLHSKYMFSERIHLINDIVLNYRIHENNSFTYTGDYEVLDRQINKRMYAYNLFLEKYKNNFPRTIVDELAGKIALETLRFKGDLFGILIFRKVSLREKLPLMLKANKFLNTTRKQIVRLLNR